MAFETSLMISRFFINNDLKSDGFHFINFAIYISNLDIKEEFKVELKLMALPTVMPSLRVSWGVIESDPGEHHLKRPNGPQSLQKIYMYQINISFRIFNSLAITNSPLMFPG